MKLKMNTDQLERLVKELCCLPAETPWVEFKENNSDPQLIGDLVSALSNAAALNGKETAWLVWGIRDGSHAIVGTDFVPYIAKKGNLLLESWLAQMLSPRQYIRFHSGAIDEKDIVVLEIPAAHNQPTMFHGKELIRVGSTNKNLRDFPQMERNLWHSFNVIRFERQIALSDKGEEDVLELLDYPSYSNLLDLPLHSKSSEILAAFEAEDFIRKNEANHWNITNLGAILFAQDITRFPTIARKAVRVIIYKGRGRLATEREQEGRKGYAVGFEGLMEFLKALLPRNEIIGTTFRRDVAMYPDLALRELIANALIHQDFAVSGSGPMVEVFEDRVETSNPGVPLGDINRLLDQPPRSRNEAVASNTENLCLGL